MKSKKNVFLKEMDYKREGLIRYAVGYPNTSFIGYSYLGFHLVHSMINQHHESVAHHFFSLPDFPKVTSSYGIPFDEYHFLGFSIPFEPDYVNVKEHIKVLNIPLYREKRKENFPIIFAGGPAVTINPLPLLPFVDFFFIGEAEGSLDVFLSVVANLIKKGKRKEEILYAISKIKGIFVPDYHGKDYFSKRNVLINLDKAYPAINKVKAKNTVFSNMYLLEIQRGCPFSCRFCASRVISHPFRYRSFDNIVDVTSQIPDGSDLGLIGTAILSHPDIYNILDYFARREIKLHFASLRADLITEKILEYLKRNRVKTLTLAPEVATDKMKKEIQKFVDMDRTIDMLPSFYRYGIRDIKMYFLYGLPGETMEDLAAIKDMIIRVKKKFKGTVSVSINPVVPKKNTPYEMYIPPPENVMREKYFFIKKMLKGMGIKSSIQSPKNLYWQYKFSCGNETVLDDNYEKNNS